MDTSILNSTKRILGLSLDDDSFDLDVITHINSAFSILSDIGIGVGYSVMDDTDDWSDLQVDSPKILNLIKTCIYLQVRMLFDPPNSSYLQDAYNRQIQEHVWRLNQMREETAWVDPDPPTLGEVA